jgi:hypothetical protein
MQSEHLTETFHKLTIYLAGPMSGYPQFNYPAFHKAAKELREAGYNVISPAEHNPEAMLKVAIESKDGLVDGIKPIDNRNAQVAGETWGDCMARDVKLIFGQCDGVVVLPGWEKSRGARLEVFLANLCGRSVSIYEGSGRVRPMGEGQYLQGITGASAVLTGGSDYGRN